MGQLPELHERLSEEWRLLNILWQIASQEWNDASRQKFEGTHWRPHEEVVPQALRELHELIQLIGAMERRIEQ